MTDTDHYTAQDIAIDNHRMDLICAMHGALARSPGPAHRFRP
jgi:hypothetical protein